MDSPRQCGTVQNRTGNAIGEQAPQGETVRRVRLPDRYALVRVPRSALRPPRTDSQFGACRRSNS
ncbi:MAG: hypothetical protein LBE84_01425 [Planctomycetota bacterium]|jgi:hypothetical protein|nr:hypothetical protein [Planctomycetota bacterium]